MEYLRKNDKDYKPCKFRDLNHGQVFYAYVIRHDLEEDFMKHIKIIDKVYIREDDFVDEFYGDHKVYIEMDPE